MRRVWPWLVAGGAVLATAFCAAVSADSVSVLLGGGFVAVQLVAPVLVVRRRALTRDLAAVREPVEPTAPRPGRAVVRWVRLDTKLAAKPGAGRRSPAAVPVFTTVRAEG
jgi:hypothetical protein